MTEKIKIACVVGTRPEAIKMAPVVLALRQDSAFETRVLASGQHLDMLTQALDYFGIAPDVNLNVMKERQTLDHVTSSVLEGVGAFLDVSPQDMLLVHGDTTTTLAAALAGFYRRIPVGHVEAGLRSHVPDSPFPEEANRVLADRLSALRFAPTELASDNLRKEGFDGASVFVTGNTVIDALFLALARSRQAGRANQKNLCGIEAGEPMVLMTAHRRESWGAPLKEICAAVRAVAERHPDLRFLVPLHKNPEVRTTITGALRNLSGIVFTEPLDYPLFVEAMNRSLFIMSDSGGVQEEATALKKPVLILRDLSERPEAVEAGTGVLVGTDRGRIESAALRLLEDEDYLDSFAGRDNTAFGDGKTSGRIVGIIKDYFRKKLEINP